MSLITTITEFKSYIAIDANTKMATLQPYINEAEQVYLIPLLGQAFYDEFAPLYAGSVDVTPVALSAENAALLPYIQRCLAYYTQLLAINHLSVTFGDLGTRVHRGEDSDPAPRWQIEKLQFQALRNGDTHADKLLEFMEANAADYATWAGSSANTSKSGLIVYKSAIASRHIAINNSRRVYLALYNKIREIEQRIVAKAIGQEQYDAIVALLVAGTALTSQQAALVAKLEPIICKRALYLQLPFMRVQVADNGLFLYSGMDELHKFFAMDADIKMLRQQLIDGELGYLADEAELNQFILDNIADYPLIEASTAYTVQPDPGPTFTPTNSCDNKHFIA